MSVAVPESIPAWEDLKAKMDDLVAATESANKAMNEGRAIILQQTAMLDLALGIMIALSQDDDVPFNIRRRLMFALIQMKGMGKTS